MSACWLAAVQAWHRGGVGASAPPHRLLSLTPHRQSLRLRSLSPAPLVRRRCALLGDRLAGLAAKNGWAGVIVHGCVRDTAALGEIEVGIKALAPCPLKSSKRDPGLKAVGCGGCPAACRARAGAGWLPCASCGCGGVAVVVRLWWWWLSPGACLPTCLPASPLRRQVRVVIGGALVRPGDWVYADEDGVLVSREALPY